MSITAEVTMRYHDRGDLLHALLTLRNENPTTQLTVIHENSEVTAHEAIGLTCTEPIMVTGGEALILLSRFNGQIIGASILEVDCDNADYGFILSPRGGFNLLLDQQSVSHPRDLHHVAGNGVALPPPGIEYIDILEAL